MAKILLVVPNDTCEPYPVYPLGASMVAHAARERGHEVRVWDYLHENARGGTLAAAIDRQQPDVIGVSLRNIDNTNSANLQSYTGWYREVLSELRSLSDRPLVLGGSGYSLFPEQLLERLGADYGVAGEGEQAFLELIERLTEGERPEQKVWVARPPLLGSEITPTERDPEVADHYFKYGGMLNVQSKRGCPLRCAYCTYPLLEGRTYRHREAADVVTEIEMMQTRFGADYVAFTDSTFNDARGRYLEIAEELLRRDVKIRFMAFFRPDRFEPEQVELLRRAGLTSVEWGSDCSTDTTLKAMRKSFSWAEVEESNRLFAEAGVKNAHFIIFGGPGETEQTVEEGLENIERLPESVVFIFRGVRVLPGTAMHKIALDEGVVTGDTDLLEPLFYYSKGVSSDYIHQAVLRSFGARADRLYPPDKGGEKVAALHRMGYKGPIWDLLLTTKLRKAGRS